MKLLNGLTVTARTMLLSALAVCFVFFIAGFAALSIFKIQIETPAAFSIGLACGCALTLVKIVWMEKAISKSLDSDKNGAKIFAFLSYLLRFALTFALLALAFLFRETVGVIGAAAGIISLRVAAFVAGRVLRDREI